MDSSRRTGFLPLALLSGIAVLILYALGGHALVADAYYQRSLPLFNGLIAYAQLHPVEFYVDKADNLLFYTGVLWLGAVMAFWLARRRLRRAPRGQSDIADRLVFLLCSAGFYVFLVRYGEERAWYPIADVMNLAAKPPFQHRMMFVAPAELLRAVIPSMSYLDSFLYSQLLAAMLALWALKRLAGEFIRKDLAFLAQPLLLAIWAPTLRYYTFYDIGIVFVFSFCLYHIYRKEFLPYLLMLALGTTNHETTLFLIATSACVWWGQMPPGRLARVLLLQLAVYGAVRALLFYYLPAHAAWEGGKLPYNIFLLTERPQELLLNLGPLLLWYGAAALGWRSAPPALRRSVIVLPCLLVMTVLVGQLHEARQFDGFLPIAVCLIVCRIAASTASCPESQRLTPRLATLHPDDAQAFSDALREDKVRA